MIDFLMVSTRSSKRGDVIEIYPKFIIKKSSDLMIRGGDFYAIWLEELGRWSTDEQDAIHLIDKISCQRFLEFLPIIIREDFIRIKIHRRHERLVSGFDREFYGLISKGTLPIDIAGSNLKVALF